MIVYHGGYTEVKEIDLSKAKLHKDFGKGFYTTNIREQAEIWAEIQGSRQGTNGFVTGFKFSESAFSDSDYKVLRFPKYTEEWFDFVVENRDRDRDTTATHNYDIVEGPVADDKISLEIDSYLANPTPANRAKFFRELSKHPIPSHQICFCTHNSLRSIERIDLKPLTRIERISIVAINDLIVKDKLPKENAFDIFYSSKVFANLSEESTKLYDKSAKKIYNMLKKEMEANISLPNQKAENNYEIEL